MEVKIKYTVIIGRLSASPWMPWTIDLTDEEANTYQNAINNKIPLNDVVELKDALDRAYHEISEYEIECASDYDDEFDADNCEIRVKYYDLNEE